MIDLTIADGLAELVRWFGYWPSFHDAEVVSVELIRSGSSKVRVHTFERTGAVDDRGFYVCRKHVVVTFLMRGVLDLELAGFNAQNVLTSLALTRSPVGVVVELHGIHGVDGSITAETVCIEYTPGPASDR